MISIPCHMMRSSTINQPSISASMNRTWKSWKEKELWIWWMWISSLFPRGLNIINIYSRGSLLTFFLREISPDVTNLFAPKALNFRIIPLVSVSRRTQSIISSIMMISLVEVFPARVLLSFPMTKMSCKWLVLIISISMLGCNPSLLLGTINP